MKLPELKQNLRTLNTNPVDLAVIEYVTPYKICVAALLHEYVRKPLPQVFQHCVEKSLLVHLVSWYGTMTS